MADMKFVATESAPKAIGPYSQGVIANGFLFTAGQTALDPATMQLVPGDVKAQTERVFENLRAVLTEAGTSFDKVVKASVFLASMDDFAAMNEVYAKTFGNHRPARSTVAVKTLPKNGLVEIDLIVMM
jgi:2-iminobutanoate/2-iminopropanoate deaminase